MRYLLGTIVPLAFSILFVIVAGAENFIGAIGLLIFINPLIIYLINWKFKTTSYENDDIVKSTLRVFLIIAFGLAITAVVFAVFFMYSIFAGMWNR
jgi:small-conductance mechanosensitive channel